MSDLLAMDLHRIFTEASLFAHKDGVLPALNGVHLEATGKHLIGVATDRFKVGASSTPYVSDPFEVTIPLEYVGMVRELLRPRGRRVSSLAEIWTSPKGKLFHVKVRDTQLTVPTSPTEFPKWRQFVKDPGSDDGVGVIGVNPQYMAVFGKIKRNRCQMWMGFQSPSKPITVRIGDDFVGLIMPVRLPDGPTWEKPDWI